MIVERFQDGPAAREAWERFVADSNNGTLFHSLRFLSYHPAERFHEHHLVFTKRGRVVALLPATRQDEETGPALVSHPGASYGGFVVRPDLRFDDATALVSALVESATQAGFTRIDLTLTPTVYMKHPHQAVEFALFSAGFRYRKRELTNVVSLDCAPDEVFQRFTNKTRGHLRQALRFGLRVVWADDPQDDALAVLYRMLLDNRRQLGLTPPPAHTLDELIRIRTLMPGRLTLGLTYLDDDPIASVLLFNCNPRAVLTFYICHERSYRHHHPVHLLLYDLLCRATRQGYRIIDFGLSTVNMAPLRSLIQFKESFLAQGFFRETFELKL